MKKKLFNLILYCDTDFLQSVLDSKLKQIDFYAYAMHDKDVYSADVYNDGVLKHSKGELKVVHTHLVMQLKTWRNVNDIKRWFVQIDDNGNNTSVLYRDAKGSIADCLKYLDHSNAVNKYQYCRDIIKSYNVDWEDIDKYDDADSPVDNCYDIIQDMLAGQDIMYMIKSYGRDFVYHYNNFTTLVNLINIRNDNRDMRCGNEFDYDYYKFEERCDKVIDDKAEQKYSDMILLHEKNVF